MALGASSPAGRTASQFPGLRVQLPCRRPSYLGHPAKGAWPSPRRLVFAAWDPLHAGSQWAQATASADSEPRKPWGTAPGWGHMQ